MVEGRETSVHLALFPAGKDIFAGDAGGLLGEWKQIFAVRDEVFRAIEDERKLGRIGKGLGDWRRHRGRRETRTTVEIVFQRFPRGILQRLIGICWRLNSDSEALKSLLR